MYVINRSNNSPTKATLFWPRHESKRVTGAGYYARTICKVQEAGKTMDTLAGQYQGSYRTRLEVLKQTIQDRKKMAHAGGR